MNIDFRNFGGGGGSEYILPKATATKLGGVKIGSGISIDADGKISATGGGGGSVPTFDLEAIFAMSDEEKAAMFPTIKAAIESGSFIAYGTIEGEESTLCFVNKAAIEGDDRVFFECYGSHSSNPNAIMVRTYRLWSDGSTQVENFSANVGGGGSTALNLNDIKDNWSEDDRKNLYNDLVSKFTNGEYFNATFKGESNMTGEWRMMGNPCISYDDGYGAIGFNFYCEYGGVKNYFVRINSNGGFEDMGI